MMLIKKIMLIYFLTTIVITSSVIVIMNQRLGIKLIPEEIFSEKIIYFSSTKRTDSDTVKIFDAMANVGKYPQTIQENVVSVKIIQNSDKEIIAQENIKEGGFTAIMTVKHVFDRYKNHKITIMEGLAKDSIINLNYTKLQNGTEVLISGEIHLHGASSLLASAIENQIQDKIDSVFMSFEKYSKN